MTSLFISGDEMLRIEDDKYYVGDDIALKEVTRQEFKMQLERYEGVCIHWNEAMRHWYDTMVAVYRDMGEFCPYCGEEFNADDTIVSVEGWLHCDLTCAEYNGLDIKSSSIEFIRAGDIMDV